MSSKALFVTDWDNISRFVQDVAKVNKLTDETRDYLNSRLKSTDDHIVLITLSVLDAFVVNCGRDVRDQLASPVWMKILLNCFVGNLSKKHIRDCISQLFSNWRQLLKGEALGQEARNVCKHIQVKNYVVPPPAEYAPDVVAAIRENRMPSEFFRGYDFYQRVYGNIAEPAATSTSSSQQATQGSSRNSSATRVTSQDSASTSAFSQGPSRGPSGGPSGAPRNQLATNASMESPTTKIGRMKADGDALDVATQECLAAGSRVQGSRGDPEARKALDESLRKGQECDVRCQSWGDAVQRMIDDGMTEADMMRALEQNERLCSIRERWASVSAHQKQILQAADSAAAAVSTLAAAHAAANVASPTKAPSSYPIAASPTQEDDLIALAPPTRNSGSFPGPLAGPPSGSRKGSGRGPESPGTQRHMQNGRGDVSGDALDDMSVFAHAEGPSTYLEDDAGPAQALPSSMASVDQNVLLVTTSFMGGPPHTRQHAHGNPFAPIQENAAGTTSGPTSPQQPDTARSLNPFASDNDLARTAAPLLAATAAAGEASEANTELEHRLKQLQEEAAMAACVVQNAVLHAAMAEQQRCRQVAAEEAGALKQQLAALESDSSSLRNQLSAVQGELALERQQVAVLKQELAASQHAAKENKENKHSTGSSNADTAVTSRAHSALEWNMLAAADVRPSFDGSCRSFSTYSQSNEGPSKGNGKRSLFRKDSFSAANAAATAAMNSAVESVAPQSASTLESRDAETAAMLAAYRRMPALRVRFTPQHFANLVTTVSEEWSGQPVEQEIH